MPHTFFSKPCALFLAMLSAASKVCVWTTLISRESLAFTVLTTKYVPKRWPDLSTQLHSQHLNPARNSQLPVIPIIGPIINAKPLMIGGEMYLDPPTPLQWKTLQECVVVHTNELNNRESDNEGNSFNDNDIMWTATIDAAPLVAIIDEATNYKDVRSPFRSNNRHNDGGRYATLAAIVGIRSNSQNGGYDQDDNEKNFLYSMDACAVDEESDFITPLSSVRMVGIGRAVLRRYFYRVPSELLCLDPSQANTQYDEKDFVDIDDTNGYADNTPIVMAEFEPLTDDASVYSIADPNKVGEKGQRSYRKSPIHALSELNNVSIRVSRLHDDRRKLIDGIKVAKARLNLYDENLEDVDGLGALFEFKDDTDPNEILNKEEMSMSVDTFLATFNSNLSSIDPIELSQNHQPDDSSQKVQEPWYGMNYFGALSSIPALTRVAAEQLNPYYSAKYREREEYDLEVSSFVAFRCLDGFADTEDMAWSLHCTSSIERLNKAYEILLDHVWILKGVAKRMFKELEECGEECADLW